MRNQFPKRRCNESNPPSGVPAYGRRGASGGQRALPSGLPPGRRAPPWTLADQFFYVSARVVGVHPCGCLGRGGGADTQVRPYGVHGRGAFAGVRPRWVRWAWGTGRRGRKPGWQAASPTVCIKSPSAKQSFAEPTHLFRRRGYNAHRIRVALKLFLVTFSLEKK